MCELNKILIIACCVWRICDAQVEGSFNDAINPDGLDLSAWHQYQRNPRVALHTNDQLECERPNIYICEEPPNAIPTDTGKDCNYRNIWYHEQVYKWVAGRGCLLYTPDFLYVSGSNPINLNTGCVYGNLFAPCLEIAKEDGTCGCFPFDPAFEEISTAVRNALVPSAQSRWESCYYTASDCCSHYMDGIVNDEHQCSPTFDGWTCWEPAPNGTIPSSVCPEFAYSNAGPICNHFSSKTCNSNAIWELQTDYSTCSITPRLVTRYRYHIAVLIISIAACLPAVFILFFYKRLRVTRVVLHRNLLIAIIVRNVLVIVTRSEIYIDELTNVEDTAMSLHGIACRVLAVAERIAANAVFLCMLVEGVYLHRMIVAIFRQKLKIKWLYGIGAVIAVLPVIAWAVTMGLLNDHSCWVVYSVPHVQWALDAPRVLVLLLNTVLFIDILRVLLTKIRNSENANQLNTAKATLFLMPIFGTQFIFTAIRPRTTSCMFEQTYYFIAYSIEGLQGFIVALLYCYVNKEVHALIKATYKKTENAVTSRIRGSNYPRISVDPNTDRRHTYSTGINSQNSDDSKNQYSTMAPKLHVAEIISIQASERLAEILDPIYETIDNVDNNYDHLKRINTVPHGDNMEDYYGFTNASSVSIGCPDWLKCTPDNSVYNVSINDNIIKNTESSDIDNDYENTKDVLPPEVIKDLDPQVDYGNETMLDEIMQCIDNKDIKLNPDLLSPNRPEGEKIVFVDQ